MTITFLGHAGFLLETECFIMIMDPWLSECGAFDSGWFQFPCNHRLQAFVKKKLASVGKQKYVYLSHEHKDHFDSVFLKNLDEFDFTYIIPRFNRSVLADSLFEFARQRIVLCSDNDKIDIEGGTVKIFTDDGELNRDSAILVSCNNRHFLNLNDCKIHDRLKDIVKEEGKIDVFACQYSGATWHPTCYDYTKEEYEHISLKKMRSKFEATAKAIETVRPNIYLPSAGPACFLDPDLVSINFEPVNIFPKTNKLLEYLDKRLPTGTAIIPNLMPGDMVDVEKNIVEETSYTEKVAEQDFKKYIVAYASRYEDFFRKRKTKYTDSDFFLLRERLIEAFERKLSSFTGRNKIERPLFIGFRDMADSLIKIDFQNNVITLEQSLPSTNYYLMKAYTYDFGRVLDKHLSWEDFSLTFRMKLNREPDVYQVLMQGFLILEAEDLERFCSKIAAIETRTERIVIEAGGCKFSTDRYCPHQGADLAEGWIEENRYLVCPRHGWRFDLLDEGRSYSNSGSVHAIQLDE